MNRAFNTLLFAVLCATSGHAHAQSAGPASSGSASMSSDPDTLIREGLALRKRGDDEEALALFARSVELKRTPRAVAQVAFAEQALGRWESAESHLAEAASAASNPWIHDHASTLEQALSAVRAHLGTLEIAATVPDAELVIDGGSRGPIRGPLRLAAGTYAIEVRRDGYYPVSRQIIIAARQTARETVELRPIEPSSQSVVAPAAAALPASAAPPASDTGAKNTRFGNLKWYTLGTAGVLAAGGVTALLLRQGQVSAYNEDASCPGESASHQPAQCDDYLSKGKTFGTLGIVGVVGGALFGVASGVLIVIDGPAPASAQRAGASAWEIRCAARF